MAEKDENSCSPASSKQLLYSEMFSGHLEEKLKVTGKKKQTPEELKKTFRPPPSSVLSRVRDFLPQLASANEQLQSMASEDVCIESVDEHDGPLIEMSLALVPCMPSDPEDSCEESEEDSDSDSDSDTCAPDSNTSAPDNSADAPDNGITITTGSKRHKKKKAGIEVLSEKDANQESCVPDG